MQLPFFGPCAAATARHVERKQAAQKTLNAFLRLSTPLALYRESHLTAACPFRSQETDKAAIQPISVFMGSRPSGVGEMSAPARARRAGVTTNAVSWQCGVVGMTQKVRKPGTWRVNVAMHK